MKNLKFILLLLLSDLVISCKEEDKDNDIMSADESIFEFEFNDSELTASLTFVDWNEDMDERLVENLIIPSKVKNNGKVYDVVSIEDPFDRCLRVMKSVNIPSSVTYIGQYTFNSCKSLTSIEIPNSVSYIGVLAFAYCEGLTNIVIPNSVTYIGGGAFSGCDNLKTARVPVGLDISKADFPSTTEIIRY